MFSVDMFPRTISLEVLTQKRQQPNQEIVENKNSTQLQIELRALPRLKDVTQESLLLRWVKMVTIVELKLLPVDSLILDLMLMLVVCSKLQRRLLVKQLTMMCMQLESVHQLLVTTLLSQHLNKLLRNKEVTISFSSVEELFQLKIMISC